MKTKKIKYAKQVWQAFSTSTSTVRRDLNIFLKTIDAELVESIKNEFYTGCSNPFGYTVVYLEEVKND